MALRLGNFELIQLLLQSGANVNYYSMVNTTHYPSALQYALRDPVRPSETRKTLRHCVRTLRHNKRPGRPLETVLDPLEILRSP